MAGGPEDELSVPQLKAAVLLGQGLKVKEVAAGAGVSERQVHRWKKLPAFAAVQAQTEMRIRGEILMNAARNVRLLALENMPSRRDKLDWLKFIAAETDKIDYSDPSLGLSPQDLKLYMTKATVKSLKRKQGRR